MIVTPPFPSLPLLTLSLDQLASSDTFAMFIIDHIWWKVTYLSQNGNGSYRRRVIPHRSGLSESSTVDLFIVFLFRYAWSDLNLDMGTSENRKQVQLNPCQQLETVKRFIVWRIWAKNNPIFTSAGKVGKPHLMLHYQTFKCGQNTKVVLVNNSKDPNSFPKATYAMHLWSLYIWLKMLNISTKVEIK